MLENSQRSNPVKPKKSAKFDWWIEIHTGNPLCTYYFGPFSQFIPATISQYGFIEDLRSEGAKILSVEIKRCQPQQWTIWEEEGKPNAIEPQARETALRLDATTDT